MGQTAIQKWNAGGRVPEDSQPQRSREADLVDGPDIGAGAAKALILLGISAYWQQVFSGVIIVAAVALNMWRRKRK